MESPSEPIKCPRCGEDMERVGSGHYHCFCYCCVWGDLVLTWHEPKKFNIKGGEDEKVFSFSTASCGK